MNEKEAIKTLIRIADNQQKIITKLAQELGQAGGPSHTDPAPFVPSHAPPTEHVAPVNIAPGDTNKREVDTILNALPAGLKSIVQTIEVHPSHEPNYDGVIAVKFAPGKSSQAAFRALENVVKSLQRTNSLPGASYKFEETQ